MEVAFTRLYQPLLYLLGGVSLIFELRNVKLKSDLARSVLDVYGLLYVTLAELFFKSKFYLGPLVAIRLCQPCYTTLVVFES